jgi:pyruvate formate lyase activating enzyme
MIRAIIETSLVDWDGKITTVIFFDKCNFMCPFCQNWDLILHAEKFPLITWEEIEKKLKKKEKWVDGVVLTGGEPLVFKEEVIDIAKKIKKCGIGVKIDTNGAYPERLELMIKEDLVDYVAMDIKAPLDKRYDTAAGVHVDLMKIKQSITLLMSNIVDYEFRTTCVPGIIDEHTIDEIGTVLNGARRWALQAYVPQNAYKKEYRKELPQNYTEQLQKFYTIAKHHVTTVIVRGKL